MTPDFEWRSGENGIDWNRRRQRRGHAFQRRYKSVVVSAAGKGQYFLMVAYSIHLNPGPQPVGRPFADGTLEPINWRELFGQELQTGKVV